MLAYFARPTWLTFRNALQLTLLGTGLTLAAGSSGTAKPKPNTVFTMVNPRCTAEPPPLFRDMIKRASFSCRYSGGVPKVTSTKKGSAKNTSCPAGTFLHGFVAICDGAEFEPKMLPPRMRPAAIPKLPTTAKEKAAMAKVMLAAHNGYRTKLNLKPLTWSERLMTEATKWAAHLAKLGGTRAVYSNPAKTGQGENIWLGRAGSFTVEQMIVAWGKDKQQEQYKQVGCALTRAGGNDILVCRYWPPGNIPGR